MVSRLTLLIGAFTLAYSFLVFHLYQLQMEKGEYYLARAASMHGMALSYGNRGTIYFTDRDGNKVPAVSNKEFPTVFATPKLIEDPKLAAQAISSLMDLPAADLTKRLSNKADTYELLGKKVNDEVASSIEALHIKGVTVQTVSERFYPFGKLAAHILGYVGPSQTDLGTIGHYGVEEYYDEDLHGKVNNGEGETLTLTIDPNVQIEAERIIKNLVINKKAKAGSVVVQDPKTGKILAMGSYPTFDPNAYSQSSVKTFLNPVVQEVYEPGSVFKPITMAAGIDAGKITPNTTYQDNGVLELNGKKIRNWDLQSYGLTTMTGVIEHSLNVGAAYAESKTGNETFASYVKRFGFGEKTGIDLLGEAKGNLAEISKPQAPQIAFATASFGQGVAVSTLEIVNAFSAIANGGTLMRPYVNAEMEPKKIRTVISKSTAEQVAGMMISALDKAQVAKINGYSLAGKTGTAQVPDLVHGGYTDQVLNTYVGFGPTTDPRFTIMIKLDQPEGAPLAGATVVPAFRDLAQFILNYYNIAPDSL